MINAVRIFLLIIALGVISLAGFYFYKVQNNEVEIEKLKSDKKSDEFKLGIEERLEIHISLKDETTREFKFSPVLLSPRNPPIFPLH